MGDRHALAEPPLGLLVCVGYYLPWGQPRFVAEVADALNHLVKVEVLVSVRDVGRVQRVDGHAVLAGGADKVHRLLVDTLEQRDVLGVEVFGDGAHLVDERCLAGVEHGKVCGGSRLVEIEVRLSRLTCRPASRR